MRLLINKTTITESYFLMKKQNPANDSLKTKIIPGLMSEYRVVSLPYWAWYWLEDFMVQNKISYEGIYSTFGDNKDLNTTLQEVAELHQEHAMREVYNLANQNEPDKNICLTKIYAPKKKQITNLPKIYKLFGFMACATTLEAVWERRHYRNSSRIK